ncbi:MAG: AAA family ATPase [Muribaculaceae bacterium]|nr:AAA family ATPase [Muribaculaceae bacterium]
MDNKLPFYTELNNSLTWETKELLEHAYQEALKRRHEYLTPEHILMVLIQNPDFSNALKYIGADIEELLEKINDNITDLDIIPEDIDFAPSPSLQFSQMLEYADLNVISCGKSKIEIIHIIKGLLSLEESWAQYLLWNAIRGEEGFFLSILLGEADTEVLGEEEPSYDEEFLNSEKKDKSEKKNEWKKLVVCLNETYQDNNPLIGREEELSKTMQVLCRKDKNNPLHIGEPGVGKTALVYGLAAMIENGQVPEKLKGSKIYRMDLGNLLAGTQFRGDFEKKLKSIMEGASNEKNAIIYIDEIHNLIGAGAVGESSLDASNILKPYLEGGKIKFIGATTYEEYKRYFARSKSIVRRFTNIDIHEPSEEETLNILKQLQNRYEDFHKVKYTEEALVFAVKGSARHINDRFLPDKAIDLIDESGAAKQMEIDGQGVKIVDKELVSKVLAKKCKVESLAITDEDPQNLETLEDRISSQLFGQEKAVNEVAESILMSKVGLSDENKPLASLLFVGPTGVGKTELARLLAKELGVDLLRFDMSEYTEKHTVAKLIGSPAGYVGYEDGGLLTDAVRKTPNSVLLLDEIEKAHPDIYNILLQVMDYAKLTDNKGNKADFRNVVVIMTSNAGAQFASQANVGFASNVTRSDAMLKQVKKIFKPEFLNRLSATVLFNEMTKEMALQILNKKLKELSAKLKVKNFKLKISEEAKNYLLEKGFTKDYGAREIDRVIQNELKKKLTKSLLNIKAQEGGEISVNLENDSLSICMM